MFQQTLHRVIKIFWISHWLWTKSEPPPFLRHSLRFRLVWKVTGNFQILLSFVLVYCRDCDYSQRREGGEFLRCVFAGTGCTLLAGTLTNNACLGHVTPNWLYRGVTCRDPDRSPAITLTAALMLRNKRSRGHASRFNALRFVKILTPATVAENSHGAASMHRVSIFFEFIYLFCIGCILFMCIYLYVLLYIIFLNIIYMYYYMYYYILYFLIL